MNATSTAALLLALALPAAARAGETIETGAQGAPPAAAGPQDPNAPQAIGDWARRVMAGEPAADADPAKPAACAQPADPKPHGAVWGGIGTGGYREVGGVVTQPVGRCGQVTVAIDRTEGGFGGYRRR